MNTNLFFYSLTEIIISLLFGIILLYSTYRMLDRFIKKKYDIANDNLAFSVFSSSILFSVAYLISGIKAPILNSLRMLSNDGEYEGSLILDGFKYTSLFLIIILIAIGLVIYLSINLYTKMTKDVNEFNEIKANNVAVSLIMATIIISISILIKESLYLMLETFVPYPDLPKIF
jgi:uncharacterized membrane protein YjfL (UPF0719 family)